MQLYVFRHCILKFINKIMYSQLVIQQWHTFMHIKFTALRITQNKYRRESKRNTPKLSDIYCLHLHVHVCVHFKVNAKTTTGSRPISTVVTAESTLKMEKNDCWPFPQSLPGSSPVLWHLNCCSLVRSISGLSTRSSSRQVNNASATAPNKM